MTETITEEVTNRADLFPKITEVHITNFMSIERAQISFDKSNIIGIRGYNDSGKSAIQRAIACCLLYHYSTKHKNFIQDGKNFFQVDVCFEDGVIIRYEKHYTGGSLYEMTRDGELLYTNRQQNGSEFLEKIIEVPYEIRRYLGMSTTDEGISLNYGLNTDKQLLVSTSGSENYAALNKILKSENLSRASQLVNQDNNALDGSISRTEAMVYQKDKELLKYKNLDESLVLKLEAFAGLVSEKEERLDEMISLEELYTGLDETIIPEIPQIPTKLIDDVSKVEELLNDVSLLSVVVPAEIPVLNSEGIAKLTAIDSLLDSTDALEEEVLPELHQVDMKSINQLSKLIDLSEDIKTLEEPEIPELKPVTSIKQAEELLELVTDVENLEKYSAILTECESQSAHLVNLSDELYKEISDSGHQVVKCNNCGELTLV